MIDLELAREHLKADNDEVEDELLTQYIASARSACEGYCGRKFYSDTDAKDEDYGLALADMQDAITIRDEELEAAPNNEIRGIVLGNFFSVRSAILARCNGVVVNDAIMAAMLMMLGHFYRNRQEVVVSQYSGATQLPAGARRILEPYLWVGDIGGEL